MKKPLQHHDSVSVYAATIVVTFDTNDLKHSRKTIMTKRNLSAAAAACVLLLPVSAFAAGTDPGFYFGGKGGASSTDSVIDDSDNSLGIYGGYRINPYFAVEAEYTDFGKFDIRFRELEFDNPRLGPRTWGARAIGFMPINESFELLGSVGYHSFDLNPRDDTGFRDVIGSGSSTDLFYGVGAQFNFSGRVSLRTQYQRYEFKDAGKINELSLGVHYRF